MLLILYGRPSLHRFAREKITAKEIEASITIIIISLAIISFLPDKTIDTWNLFNPQNFGIIFLILASLQFGGYIVIRLFGKRLGIILIGFLAVLFLQPPYSLHSHKKLEGKRKPFTQEFWEAFLRQLLLFWLF
ncbi:hypothetical protein Lsan_0123 [Legionella santicrucis]|uniref:Uncharacterized protein n=1 Tax=Legionella santicrucis TaxID=45074 RepID=A0A0W0ZKQ5_9GAMM|nr:hypothetical protein Lsan_0123 [Legionella santicrucis]